MKYLDSIDPAEDRYSDKLDWERDQMKNEACRECGDKLTLPDEIKYGICRGCASLRRSK